MRFPHHSNKVISLLTVALVLILIPNAKANGKQAELIWAPEPLNRLIAEGLSNNNEIQSIIHDIEALKKDVIVAGALNDPMIGFSLANVPIDSFRFDQEPMTQKQLFILQKVPWFGKLDLKSKKVAVMAVKQEAVLVQKKYTLARNLADLYYELGFISSSEKLNDRLHALVSQLLKVSETRYTAGNGLQQDILRAQVELSLLWDEKVNLEKTRRLLEDRINGLLNRDSYVPVIPPENLSIPRLDMDKEALTDLALRYNPVLAARRMDMDMAAIEIEIAKKDYMPDMEFKLVYGQRDDGPGGINRDDFLSASVAMSVPFWKAQRQDNALAAAQDRQNAAIKRYRNLEKSVPHQIDAMITEINENQKNYDYYHDALILQAAQWTQSSLSAYETGKLDFDSMVAAQIRLLRLELKAQQYLFNIYKKRAALEEIVGHVILVKSTDDDTSEMSVTNGDTK